MVDRQLLEDGRQLIALEGVERFRVKNIKKTLPYVLGEVVTCLKDNEDINNTAAQLEIDVWKYVKYYLRLMRSYEPNSNMKVSPATRDSRPLISSSGDNNNDNDNDKNIQHERRTSFSFSVANMIQMTQSRESQLILQTTDLSKRFEAMKAILVSASELIAEQLIELKVINEEKKESIRFQSFLDDDLDDDILPNEKMIDTQEEANDPWANPEGAMQ